MAPVHKGISSKTEGPAETGDPGVSLSSPPAPNNMHRPPPPTPGAALAGVGFCAVPRAGTSQTHRVPLFLPCTAKRPPVASHKASQDSQRAPAMGPWHVLPGARDPVGHATVPGFPCRYFSPIQGPAVLAPSTAGTGHACQEFSATKGRTCCPVA